MAHPPVRIAAALLLACALGVACATSVTDDSPRAVVPDSSVDDGNADDGSTGEGADAGSGDATPDASEEGQPDTGLEEIVPDDGAVGEDADAAGDALDGADAAEASDDAAADAPQEAGCGATQKLCGSQCVEVDDPQYGCDAATCNPCGFAHATARCDQGQCALDQCAQGYQSCDGNPANGCETNVTNNAFDCGFCDNVCSYPNAGASCSSGLCQLGTCSTNYQNCDGSAANGCETNISSDPENCGTCLNQCPAGGGTAVCSNKICSVSTCSPGTADCDNDPLHTCETTTDTNLANCGFCDNLCNLPNATEACVAGTCTITQCNSGYDDCDPVALNGCESLLYTTANCGGCNVPCAPADATGSCSTGICVIQSCNSGYADCSGGAGDGCETDTRTDPNHCGSCPNVCGGANGTPYCSSGICGIACTPGYDDCDGQSGNGCEVTLATDQDNCGTCGAKCASINSSGACSNSQCQESCFPGYENCDGSGTNGCEVATSGDVTHCGGCNTVCPNRVNASRTCSSGSCGFTCNAGYGDCDTTASNGCEADLATDDNHCGNCNTQCGPTETCTTSACYAPVSCGSTSFDCNGLPTDGCECTSGTGCCGAICQTAHHNGIGQSWGEAFYDCETTLNLQLGRDACFAYTSNMAQCFAASCTGPGSNKVVCSQGSLCICWTYAGSNAGHVYSSGSASCLCGNATTPSWN